MRHSTSKISFASQLTERLFRRHKHVKGSAVAFLIDKVTLPNGKQGHREYLDHPGAVGIVPLLTEDKIILVRQYRYPVGQATWEIPAGKLGKNESPLPCAKRELEEETGYKAGRIKKLLSFWPTAAFANEEIFLYTAHDLKRGTFNPDDDEFLQVKVWPLKKALQYIKTGRIKDSKTIIALMAYAARKK